MKPKANQYITFKLEGTAEWQKAKVLSCQPKRTGTYKDWINIEKDFHGPESVNWKDVEEWMEVPEPEKVLFLTKTEEFDQAVVDAKEKELRSLIKNDVFEEVDFDAQKTISTRWVFTEKIVNDKRVVKARLVARGFEEKDLSLRTDSPTCSKYALRLVMVSAVTHKWTINSLDIASAFLQGNPIEREIYLRPPAEICGKNKVWRLRRCIYGLSDAPRAWYSKVTEELVKLGGVKSTLDNAMFMWFENDQLVGHLVCHVDDFVYGGNDDWLENVIEKVKECFNISKECEGSFKFIGLNVIQEGGMITLDQRHYVRKVEEIPLSHERKSLTEAPLTDLEISQLKALSGQMIWIASQTRPDMSFETCCMSNTGKSPTVSKIVFANKAVRKMQSTNEIKLRIPYMGTMDKIEIVVFGDATHASLPDGSSQGAFIVFLKGKGKITPILWQSKKLKRVTKSPLASETLAFGEAADAGLLVAEMVKEINMLKVLPKVEVITDSKSLKDGLQTTNTVEDMSLRVNIARLREMTAVGEISVTWVEGKSQLADALTKRGASTDTLLRVLTCSEL